MKKSALIVFTLLTALTPVAAFASPQAQSSVQAGGNNATTIGAGNATVQGVSNTLNQDQFNVGGYGIDPQIQQSVQAGQNNAATLGVGNATVQGVENSAGQIQTDYNVPVYPY